MGSNISEEHTAYIINCKYGSSHLLRNISTNLPYYVAYTLEGFNLSKIAITKYWVEIHGMYVQYKYVDLLYLKYK
jgi:hypothetical protein